MPRVRSNPWLTLALLVFEVVLAAFEERTALLIEFKSIAACLREPPEPVPA